MIPPAADAYQPTSRRPIAGMFRATARYAVTLCMRHGIHADAISYTSVVFAGMAALCFQQAGRHHWLLIAGPLFCYLRLWCNMLDGMVAMASGKASLRGEILNDLPDRISDILIFVGVAHSGLCSPFSGYWAAILALLTAYVGTLGQAVGAKREFSGIMSKPWRMVALHLGAWTAFAVSLITAKATGTPTILDWTCIVIVIGCVETIVVRLRNILVTLAA
jgi:phosphatidylglycerophosphate synthase